MARERLYNDLVTYGVRSLTVTGTVTASATQSIGYLWHPSSDTKNYYIWRIWIGVTTTNTAGINFIETHFISAEGTGGTAVAAQPFNRNFAASNSSFKYGSTGQPTYVGTPLTANPRSLVTVTGGMPDASLEIFNALQGGEPIILRATVNEGLDVRQNVLTALTTAPVYICGFQWSEE